MLNILDFAPLQATTNSTAFTGWFPLFMSTGRLPSSVLIRQPQLPESLRICQYCRSNQIEDENHFLFHCGRCKTIRQQITSDIVLKYPSFYLLNNTDKTREFYAHRSMFSCTIRVRFPTLDFVASIAYFLSALWQNFNHFLSLSSDGKTKYDRSCWLWFLFVQQATEQ